MPEIYPIYGSDFDYGTTKTTTHVGDSAQIFQ